jgi:hypothetical protein
MVLRSNRLEWIYLVYLVFFVLAVLSPSIYSRGYLGLSETALEEITIFLFGMAGLLTFAAYEYLMENREQEQERVQTDYKRAKTELIEAYTYIGAINRKIELLKKTANTASLQLTSGKQNAKELFQALTANACAAAGAESVLVRVVELPKLRTDREYAHHTDRPLIFRVPNRDLRAVHDQGATHAFLRSEDGREILVVPSDRSADFKAYLLIAWPSHQIPELDHSLLKVFANQAEMLYYQLFQTQAQT